MPYPDNPSLSPTAFYRKIQDLAHPQYFMVAFPNAFNNAETLSLLASSTALPAKTIDEVAVPVQGLNLKFAGNPSFADWTVTFRAERLHRIRNTFMKWSENCVQASTLLRNVPAAYKTDTVQVFQLSPDGKIVSGVRFVGMWPGEVGEITLGHGESAPEEFSVSFKYDLWQMADAQSGNFVIDIDIDAGGVMIGSELDVDSSPRIETGFGTISLG